VRPENIGVACSARVKQPCVEVRFDNLCASTLVPAGSSNGPFTVGVDMKVKALVRHFLASHSLTKYLDICELSCALHIFLVGVDGSAHINARIVTR
jgi:hypothetical protein